MSEERYRIVKKIEEGGSGSVYVAYDTRLNREVAIKRINSQLNDWSEGSIETVLREARALSALQHPNIVTIYDAAIDSDGPFVVMELLSGQNIDDLIAGNSLVIEDFIEFATQCLEGLIAAHDIPLIHRDIKPNNIVLKWLPSGKFQAKLLDFGMAKLAHQPTKQTVDQNDSVFGSIYYMAPEQFERTELDARTDLYALGSVFYYTLAGTYPFTGDTAAAVMVSHLQHHVTPLAEKRPDIPTWIADWVMWMIRRDMSERPRTAKQALDYFNKQLKGSSLKESQLHSFSADTPPSTPVRVTSAAAEIPASPRELPTKPKTTPVAVRPIARSASASPASPTLVRPQEAVSMPTKSSKPVLTSAPAKRSQAVLAKRTTAQVETYKEAGTLRVEKSRNNAGLNAILAVVVVALIVAGGLLAYRLNSNSKIEEVNRLLAQAQEGSSSVSTSAEEVDTLLNQLYVVSGKHNNELIYRRLAVAQPFDGTDIDVKIAQFATIPSSLIDEVRIALFNVIRARKGEAALPYLLDYIQLPNENKELTAKAIRATKSTATADNLNYFLEVLLSAEDQEIKTAAEDVAKEIISESENREKVVRELKAALFNTEGVSAKAAVIRLLGNLGGDEAKSIIVNLLEKGGDEHATVLPAIRALKNWPDASMTESTIKLWEKATDPTIRKQSFDATIYLLSKYYRKDTSAKALWQKTSDSLADTREKMKFISTAIMLPKPLSVNLITEYESDPDPLIAERAKNALLRLSKSDS